MLLCCCCCCCVTCTIPSLLSLSSIHFVLRQWQHVPRLYLSKNCCCCCCCCDCCCCCCCDCSCSYLLLHAWQAKRDLCVCVRAPASKSYTCVVVAAVVVTVVVALFLRLHLLRVLANQSPAPPNGSPNGRAHSHLKKTNDFYLSNQSRERRGRERRQRERARVGLKRIHHSATNQDTHTQLVALLYVLNKDNNFMHKSYKAIPC